MLVRDCLHRGVTALHHLAQHLGIERRCPLGRAHVGGDADDLAPPRPRRRRRADTVTEDVSLERLQRGRRVQAKLVRQYLPRVGVRRERVGLAAAAVERQHELRAQRLAQRMLGDERLELAHQVRVAAECEVGIDARAQARET